MKKNNTSQLKDIEKNRPILQFSVLCDGITRQNNKPIFIGVFDHLVRTGIIPQFFIVNRWVYGQGMFKQKIAIEDPDLKKTVIETTEQELILKEETNSADMINGFVNVNFEQPGVYWIKVLLENDLIMSYPLPVYEQQKNN